MILERQNVINLRQLQSQLGGLENRPELKELSKLIKLYQLYQSGQKEISTKLENLDSEFQVNFDYNPIHHMESRMKTMESLLKKAERKGYDLTAESVQKNIYDIAGIRVITNYVDDIYNVDKKLVDQYSNQLHDYTDELEQMERGMQDIHKHLV